MKDKDQRVFVIAEMLCLHGWMVRLKSSNTL